MPYFAQTELLCGGAAAAMVLRYWGMVGVRAEDFSGLVSRTRGGMRAEELAESIRQLGWEAFAFSGGFAEARRHLRLGRPVVALLEVDAGRFHYVVFVGEAGDRLIFHDPAGSPYRLMDREELERAWGPTGYLGLLVLPPPDRQPNVRPPATRARRDSLPATDRDALPAACRGRLDRALSAAAGGRLAEADDLLAGGPCADHPAFLRERAGVRLRRGRTADAVALARRALAVRPDDEHAARTLATALYVRDRPDEALDAWNRADEPTVDLV
ncbi:MAG: cysteine peptidase family C39 domain-containing protein, partial [Gemmatimonadales bacterium]